MRESRYLVGLLTTKKKRAYVDSLFLDDLALSALETAGDQPKVIRMARQQRSRTYRE